MYLVEKGLHFVLHAVGQAPRPVKGRACIRLSKIATFHAHIHRQHAICNCNSCAQEKACARPPLPYILIRVRVTPHGIFHPWASWVMGMGYSWMCGVGGVGKGGVFGPTPCSGSCLVQALALFRPLPCSGMALFRIALFRPLPCSGPPK